MDQSHVTFKLHSKYKRNDMIDTNDTRKVPFKEQEKSTKSQ